MKRLCLICLSLFLSLATLNANASLDGALSHFYDSLGYANNVTGAEAYHDQLAGYYTGGSIFLRRQVQNYQLISMQMAHFSIGCSGINAYLGSFSMMTSDQAMRMVKNILGSAGMYAFDLALTTTVPQIKTVKDFLQKLATEVNNTNINSCNMGQDLVAGLWPKTRAAQQQICRDIGVRDDKFSDWAEARWNCGGGGKFNDIMSGKNDRANETIVNKNLVWDALSKNGLTSSDTALAEFLMSLSGSIIVRTGGKNGPTRLPLAPLGNSRALMRALLHGGSAKIYTCGKDTGKCLTPSLTTVTVSANDALVNKVSNMMARLNDAVASDSGHITPDVRGFLEMTPLPVLKFITTNLSLGKAMNPTQYSQVIALSLLNQFLSSNMAIVRQAMSVEDTALSPKMLANMNRTEHLIAVRLANQYRALGNVNGLINQMRANETMLASRLAGQAVVGQESQ